MTDKSIQQWSTEETNALLAIWGSTEIQEKLEGAVRKTKIYEEIRRELEVAGYSRTVEQITNKLKKIKKEYRDYKKELGKSGAGRMKVKSGVNMDFLDNIIGKRPANQLTGALNSATAMLEQICDDCDPASSEPGKFSCVSIYNCQLSHLRAPYFYTQQR